MFGFFFLKQIPIKSKGESDSHTDQGELTQIEARQKQLIEKLVKLQDEVAKLEGQFGVKYQPKSGNQVKHARTWFCKDGFQLKII